MIFTKGVNHFGGYYKYGWIEWKCDWNKWCDKGQACPFSLLMHALCFVSFALECRIDNCEACFSKSFCTKCKEGLYSHRGRCYSSCPKGFGTTNGTMECVSTGACRLVSVWNPLPASHDWFRAAPANFSLHRPREIKRGVFSSTQSLNTSVS